MYRRGTLSAAEDSIAPAVAAAGCHAYHTEEHVFGRFIFRGSSSTTTHTRHLISAGDVFFAK